MLDSFLAFLLKYRPLAFEQGDFRFTAPWPLALIVVVAATIALGASLTYTRARGKSGAGDRAVLMGIRLAVLGVVLFSLLRPVLVLSSVVPQQNFLGILLDDSRSMQIADRDGESRAQFLQAQFVETESALRTALADRFMLRFFRFASTTTRMSEPEELGFAGTRSYLGQALDRAREELAGVPLSGLVVVSDGADNSETELATSLLPLQAGGVPVYTVGLGRETFDRDIQLSRIELPRSVLQGASLVVDVAIVQRGYEGATVPLQIEDEGRIVTTEAVRLGGDGEPTSTRVRFTASEAGPRLLSFRIPPQPGEMVTQNNTREVLLQVDDRREKILYFEGEPRFEVKFIRRAVADDDNLQVVVLQRTAENKYLRLDVDGADDLAAGFPRTRAELFSYSGLVLGSVEANFFTPDQLRMIADFVNQRGGGFLMLGSRHSFAEGGYAGTPVADILPVVLEPGAESLDDEGPDFVELAVQPTRLGATHAATQVAETEEASAERWETMPLISSLNPIREVKPGATVLLTGQPASGDDERVVLAFQRYGSGKALALTIQDSWMWQMHADVPVEDTTHETFWRRLLRWLVDGVPDRVVARTVRDHVEIGESAELLAEVVDVNHVEINNSTVVAEVMDPLGRIHPVPMEWTGEGDGEYEARFAPEHDGLHEVRVEAVGGDEVIGADVTNFLVAPSDAEYFDGNMRASLLERVADETGGQFYTADTVAALPDDISYTGGGVTVVDELALWDMPLLLILFMLLVSAEWGYRRIRGLA